MTAQIHELLILGDTCVGMASTPPLPLHHPRLIARTQVEPADADLIASTDCWRRYRGVWEIKEERLYLMSVQGRYELVGAEPLFADWVSSSLCVPEGQVLQYVHMGFETVYEGELWLDVAAGVVTNRFRIDHRPRA
jgi:hypothetical protein